MDIQLQEHTSQINTITLNGRLEAFTVAQLREAQENLLDAGGTQFIVDLSNIEFMDSAGMSALVSLLKRSRQVGGDVILVKPSNDAAYRILTLTRFDQVFTMTDTAGDALTLFQ